MNLSSFNAIQGQNTTVQPSNQPMTLRHGQIFHGTINKIFPDQTAELQVGQQKLVAKLEVPLKVGDAQFFQVTNTGATPELKVVTGPMSPQVPLAQQMTQLLDAMNLPKTTEMQQVLGSFIKMQLPISKEQLLQAEQWLKNLPANVTKLDALHAMHKMVELKMPFTNDVFQAMTQGAKTSGMTTSMANLAQMLAQPGGNDALKANIGAQMETLAKPFNAETGGVLLARAVQTLTDVNAAVGTKLQALAALKEAGIVPANATLQNWQAAGTAQNQPASLQQPIQAGQLIQQLANSQPENSAKLLDQVRQFIASEPLLTTQQKEQMTQLMQRFSQLPQTKQTFEIFTQQLQQQMTKAFSENAQNRIFTQNEQGLTVKDHLLSLIKPDGNPTLFNNLVKVISDSPQPQMQIALTQVEAQVQNAVDGKAMEQAMKSVLKGLGVSYEAALASKAGDVSALAQQLKPQLLALMQDVQTPLPLRDAAETVLARMNGMQLLSTENGHQHQLVMQVPLEFFGKRMDATLQWNGRMKEDGKIDANFARILFYLQMESIEETMIDMQVQNRVVTINVFNDHPHLELLAEPLKQALKAGLEEKEYRLSGVFIKPFEQEQVTVSPPKPDEREGGVDIRV
ncbi:MAG: hypothetical protein ABS948_02495 [Solibacillus sp.]